MLAFAALARVLDDAPHGPEAVPPRGLLAFLVGSACIGDPDLVDAASQASPLGDQFGLDTEAVFFDLQLLDDLSREGFVAPFDIGEIQVGEYIGE
jgi:hypothetical protein